MTTYTFTPIAAGRRFGPHPCRDPSDTDYAYHIRERDGATHYDGVKINLRTGAVTVLQSWAAASNFDALGACFADPTSLNSQTNLALSLTGSKIYLFAYSGTTNNADNRVVELNKADMSISKFYGTAAGVLQRANGVVASNADGSLLARAGSRDYTIGTPNVFNGSIIELYRPSDDAYGFVNVSTLLGITGMIGLSQAPVAPIAFDANGFLWTIDQPWASGSGLRPDYQTAASSLRKLQVTDLGGGALSLSLVATYAIADDFYAYAPGVAGALTFAESFRYARFVCNHATNRLYMWSAWRPSSLDDQEGWFFEVNATTGAFVRGPIDWAGEVRQVQSQKQDNAAGFHCDETFVTVLEKSSTAATACLNLFDITPGTERQYTLDLFTGDPFNYPIAINDIGFYHCAGTESGFVYAFDAASDFPEYEDALFSVTDIEEPPAVDTPSVTGGKRPGGPFPSAMFMPPLGHWAEYAVIVHLDGAEVRPSKAFPKLGIAQAYVETILEEGITFREEFYSPSDILHIWLADEDGNMNQVHP